MARFDNKTTKQVATTLKITEWSGVTRGAHEGANVVLCKAFGEPTENPETFEVFAKSIFSDMIGGREVRDRIMNGLMASMDTLYEANREAKDTDALKQNITDYATKVMELCKAGENFAYVDGDTKKLPLDTPQRVKDASAALSPGGFRGKKVQIPADKLEAVKAKVRAAYRKAYPDLDIPKHLEKYDMSDTNKVAELEKQLATANALASLNDVEKAHYHTLDSDEKRAQFLKQSPEEREATVDMMKAADETYTASNGNTLRKSALGTDVFEMLKSQDEELVKMRDEQQVQSFIKVAQGDERKHLPGEDVAKAAALRAIDALPADVKKTIGEMLNAGNASLGKEFTVKASGHTQMATSQETFDTLVKSHMDEHKVDIGTATQAVMNTAEGEALYGEIA